MRKQRAMTANDVQVGDSYKLFFDAGNPNNHTLHVRGIIDGRFVVREWTRKSGGFWRYRVESAWFFDHYFAHGELKRVAKPSNPNSEQG